MEWITEPWCTKLDDPPVHNFSSRDGLRINCIGIHYTAGGSPKGSYKWFTYPEAKASAHFIVGRRGEIYQCVSMENRAWHFGNAELEYDGAIITDHPDRCAIGIEIANYGKLMKTDTGFYVNDTVDQYHRYDDRLYGDPIQADLVFASGRTFSGFWEPYKEDTIDAVVKLCGYLVKEFSIPLKRIVGHEDVALPEGRKIDPGPAWDWKKFIERLSDGLGLTIPDDIWELHKTVR